MKNADLDVGILRLNGVDFRYVREGEGPPIVVIGSSTYYPRAFSPALREHFELIFVDSRHFIPSYQPTEKELESLTLETFADDIEALRTHLRLDTTVGRCGDWAGIRSFVRDRPLSSPGQADSCRY